VLKDAQLSKYLSTHEKQEIIGFPDVYTVGEVLGSEKDQTLADAVSSSGTGAGVKHYNFIPRDHLNYQYLALQEQGRGTYGLVLSAQDKKSHGNLVAVKVLANVPSLGQADERRMLEREIDILRRLSQVENVVKFFDCFQFRQHTALVFELLYVDLDKDIQRRHRLSPGHDGPAYTPEQIRSYCHQLVQALRALQSHKIVHGDIKPDNIMISAEVSGANDVCQIKLVDFGRAWREVDGSYPGWAANKRYAAPDQLLGAHIGPGVDAFAVGCVLFELMTGEPLFSGIQPESSPNTCMYFFLRSLGKPPHHLTRSNVKYPQAAQFFQTWDGLPRDEVTKRHSLGTSCTAVLKAPHYLNVADTPAYRLSKKAPASAADFVLSLLQWEPGKRQLAFDHSFLDDGAHITFCSSSGCKFHLCCQGMRPRS
jgi:hypothetical protein